MKNIFRNLKELYWKYDRPVHLALVMALAALYFLDVNQYMYRVLIMIGLYAILALSLNIILGLTGMLSMGHAAFYSIGAYASAVMGTRYGMGFFSSRGHRRSVLRSSWHAAGADHHAAFRFLSGHHHHGVCRGCPDGPAQLGRCDQRGLCIQQIPRPSVMGYELTTANGGLYLLVCPSSSFPLHSARPLTIRSWDGPCGQSKTMSWPPFSWESAWNAIK